MSFQLPWQLRAEFARRLSHMYGREVPAYTTLVEVSEEVNQDCMDAAGAQAERLGSIERVTAERHGAIRVGSREEMSKAARVFAAFGMHPVGFYDLRDASASSVPVVSTAFRPIDPEELARNPFRVFTSMLASDDPRFFAEELQARLRGFIGQRTIFPAELLELADRAAAEGGLPEEEAQRLLELARGAFELSSDPVDYAWYRELEEISAVAADIGGVSSTHINHLTPRVLDIDELYRRMEARGITMIDEVQGPPGWDGPDVLLRQTSFRALDEARIFRFEDGTVGPGDLRVRFGEVEQRGIALTPAGRELYDRMMVESDQRAAEQGRPRVEAAQEVWEKNLPRTELELALQGLGCFTFRLAEEQARPGSGSAEPLSLRQLLQDGVVIAEPIVYEDFLPRSAAGIFQSNLQAAGSRDDALQGTDYSIEVMSEIVGRPVADPYELYLAQQADSVSRLERELGASIALDLGRETAR